MLRRAVSGRFRFGFSALFVDGAALGCQAWELGDGQANCRNAPTQSQRQIGKLFFFMFLLLLHFTRRRGSLGGFLELAHTAQRARACGCHIGLVSRCARGREQGLCGPEAIIAVTTAPPRAPNGTSDKLSCLKRGSNATSVPNKRKKRGTETAQKIGGEKRWGESEEMGAALREPRTLSKGPASLLRGGCLSFAKKGCWSPES